MDNCYTVECRSMVKPGGTWEPIERSWECQNPFERLDIAERVAETLALRSDGERAYRVVDRDQQLQVTFWVTKQLTCARPGGSEAHAERRRIPPGMVIPMVSEVLSGRLE